MAYLAPHFEYDAFVSYSQGDPRRTRDAPLRDWTRALIRKLESQILSLETEFDDLSLWIDAQVDPTAHLTDDLRAKVSSSGILMIVMSKRYLQSTWCRDELEWFGAQIRDRSADPGRVFVIRIQPTEISAWPNFLRDERGYGLPGFAFYDPQDGEPFGFPDLQELNEACRKELGRLRSALVMRLRELRDRRAKRVAASAPSVPAAPGRPRRIYLHSHPNHAAEREDVGRLLLEDDIAPLTAQSGVRNDLAGWREDDAALMETAKRCQALALLRAEGGADFVDDFLDIGVDECKKISVARGAPLPCAILDRTGTPLPFDAKPFDIERFDLKHDGWRGEFRAWLDRSQAPNAP